MADKMNNPERGLRRFAKPVVLAGGLALGAAGIGYAATRNEGQPTPPPPTVAAASPTPEKTVTPTATATVKPTETTKPTEVLKVPCQVLPIEVCNTGKLVEVTNNDGTITTYIAFESLPQGTSLFSAIDGERTTAQIPNGSGLQGSLLSIFPTDRSASYTFVGDFKWSDKTSFKSGDVAGSISNTGIKSFGKYELLFTAATRNGSTGRLEADKITLKKLFPQAFETDPIKVLKDSPATIITSPSYYDKP